MTHPSVLLRPMSLKQAVPQPVMHERWAALRQHVAVVSLVTLLLSLGALTNPALLDFFSPLEIVRAWVAYLGELAVIAAVLLLIFSVLDRALPRVLPWRLAVVSATLLAASIVLALLLHAYYAGGFAHLPRPLRIVADSLRWGLPAVFLAVTADVHRRTLQADRAVHTAELTRTQLEQVEIEQQLAMLQAQIEPHFLFNMLGNVRRLYRTQPLAGAEAVGSLMRYLRSALPQLRSRHGRLGDELALVKDYLDLFKLRMGEHLQYSIECDDELHAVEFPATLLVTLVENALKHGLEPRGGGRVDVRARCGAALLEVQVLDDGVGFVAIASSGTGLGLANIRRQLAARYQGGARLSLQAREPRGACATISIPLIDKRREPHAVAIASN